MEVQDAEWGLMETAVCLLNSNDQRDLMFFWHYSKKIYKLFSLENYLSTFL